MKIFILTNIDLCEVGYNAKDVEVFTEKEKATERMRELYVAACEKCDIKDPFEQHSIMNECSDDFAYVFGKYYFDIFEKEV